MKPRSAVPEALIVRLWAEGRSLASKLRTTDGRRLVIEHPGRPNAAGGPDFLGACLWLDGRRFVGDVEVHARPSDWRAHRHDADPAYDGVILHAVLTAPGAARDVLTHEGHRVPTFVLIEHLTEGWDRLRRKLRRRADAPLPTRCPRSGELRERPLRLIGRALDRAGDLRLGGKVRRYASWLAGSGPDQVVYAALLEALGYARNRKPMLALAWRLDVRRLVRPLRAATPTEAGGLAQALLLGTAGLLPGSDSSPEAALVVEHWARHKRALSTQPMSARDWVRAGVRPANQPARRLAGFGAVLPRLLAEGPAAALLAPLTRVPHEPEAFLRCLRAPLETPLGEVWTPRGEPPDAPAIGKERLDDITVNVLIPWVVLWAVRRGDRALARTAREAYARRPPLAPNVLTRAVTGFFAGGDARRRRIVRGARRGQGLLHVAREYCGPVRCHACPLCAESLP